MPAPERLAVERVLIEAAAAFPGDGIVRIEWSRADAAQAPQLTTTTRPLEAGPDVWRVARAAAVHPGPGAGGPAKATGVPAIEEARAERARAGVDETWLFDLAGRLVEGSRSCCLVVGEDGLLRTPALALGGVAGLGLAVVRHAWPELREAELDTASIEAARELLAVNVVRGVVPVVEFDGRSVGDGRPGPWAQRLAWFFAPKRG